MEPGDTRVLTAARQEARKRFEQQANLASDSPAIGAGIAHAEEVARILRHNIVQGQPQMPTATSSAGRPSHFYSMSCAPIRFGWGKAANLASRHRETGWLDDV